MRPGLPHAAMHNDLGKINYFSSGELAWIG